jgi:hypothetical protein
MPTSTTLDISAVDGATVPEAEVQTDTVTTVGSADDQLMQVVQQINTAQQDYGQMMVICCGLIIGILLCGLVRWWR